VTNLLAAATIPDAITFAIAAVICVVGAFGVVLARNPVHSALMLVMTLFGVAVLFVEENAQFLAAVQVIVYAGAIVVLFLFVIMLLGVDRHEAIERDPLPGQRLIAVCLGILGLVELILLARGKWPHGPRSVSGPLGTPADNVSRIGKSVFTTYLLAFEVTSALLVIAVVGAVVLARRPRRAAGDDGAPFVEPDDSIGDLDAGEPEPLDQPAEDTEAGAAVEFADADAEAAPTGRAAGRTGP
jgi:NADH-quinone oxidoreductase subunit J